jgi:cell wall-associated NlpC family hydrolase
VSPEDYAAAKARIYGDSVLRTGIVETAESFVGLPYRWGGSSAEEGFDCSGLTMAVYQLNGLNLPRMSGDQFRAGTAVPREGLSEGDLVFFAISGGQKVSHVGIYVGDGRFIHSPGRGKAVRVDSLSDGYYDARYMGGKTYL